MGWKRKADSDRGRVGGEGDGRGKGSVGKGGGDVKGCKDGKRKRPKELKDVEEGEMEGKREGLEGVERQMGQASRYNNYVPH